MKVLKGISAASGICQGVICIYMHDVEETIPHYEIGEKQVSREVERLGEAFQRAQDEMSRIIAGAERLLDKQTAEILKVHLLILQDKKIQKDITSLIAERKINAEHAVKDIFDAYAAEFAQKQEHFAELAHDYFDMRNHVLTALNIETGKFKCPIGEQGAMIVAAKRLTPSLVLGTRPEHVLAFIADEGGVTSHATILARSYGVPIIFGINVDSELDCGMQAIIDGSLGKVIIAPDKKTRAYYNRKIETLKHKQQVCEIKKDHYVQTKTGQRVTLRLNISTPAEMNMINDVPHDGIGLLRTEFLFIQRDSAPSEDEQYTMYAKLFDQIPDQPVTVRLLDIGTDKLPSYIKISDTINLDLSLRGALAVERFPKLYLSQVKALLRANKHGNVRFLYPMVSDLQDLQTYRSLLEKARAALKREKVPFKSYHIEEGIMIETPAAVMLAQELLREVDFINIGSNDLLQYTLAASRGNRIVEERYHILHPALLRMLELIIKEGKRARKEVCLCGEIASFEEFYPVLIKLGLKSFSVTVGKFSDIKCELLHVDKYQYKDIIKDYYQLISKKEADRYFAEFV